MSIIIPVLIISAAVLPVLVVVFLLRTYASRQKQPDMVRLRVLRGLLWYVAILSAVYVIANVVCLARGEHTSSSTTPPVSLLLAFTAIVYQMQRIQKRLKKSSA